MFKSCLVADCPFDLGGERATLSFLITSFQLPMSPGLFQVDAAVSFGDGMGGGLKIASLPSCGHLGLFVGEKRSHTVSDKARLRMKGGRLVFFDTDMKEFHFIWCEDCLVSMLCDLRQVDPRL